MKFLFPIAFLVLCIQDMFGQSAPNSKMEAKRLEYLNSFLSKFKSIDTIYKGKDSIIINYLDSNRRLIKSEIHFYYDTVRTDSVVVYYNDRNIKEYIEHWSLVSVIWDSPQWGMIEITKREPYPSGCFRYEYNKDDKLVLSVVTLADGRMFKKKDIYNKDGQYAKSESKEINESEFWDEY